MNEAERKEYISTVMRYVEERINTTIEKEARATETMCADLLARTNRSLGQVGRFARQRIRAAMEEFGLSTAPGTIREIDDWGKDWVLFGVDVGSVLLDMQRASRTAAHTAELLGQLRRVRA